MPSKTPFYENHILASLKQQFSFIFMLSNYIFMVKTERKNDTEYSSIYFIIQMACIRIDGSGCEMRSSNHGLKFVCEYACLPEQKFMPTKCRFYYGSNLILYWKHLRDYNFRIRIIIYVPIVHITLCSRSWVSTPRRNTHTFMGQIDAHMQTQQTRMAKRCIQHAQRVLDFRQTYTNKTGSCVQNNANIFLLNSQIQ